MFTHFLLSGCVSLHPIVARGSPDQFSLSLSINLFGYRYSDRMIHRRPIAPGGYGLPSFSMRGVLIAGRSKLSSIGIGRKTRQVCKSTDYVSTASDEGVLKLNPRTDLTGGSWPPGEDLGADGEYQKHVYANAAYAYSTVSETMHCHMIHPFLDYKFDFVLYSVSCSR
jgi:hypothetical protein